MLLRDPPKGAHLPLSPPRVHSPNQTGCESSAGCAYCAAYNAHAPAPRQLLTQRPLQCRNASRRFKDARGKACPEQLSTVLSPDMCGPLLGAPCALSDPEPPGKATRALRSILSPTEVAEAQKLPLFEALCHSPPLHKANMLTLQHFMRKCGDLCVGMDVPLALG